MNITTETKSTSLAPEALYAYLSNMANYESIMPDQVERFKAYEDEFKFGLKGLPEVKLKWAEGVENERIVLASSGSSIEFQLVGTIQPNGSGGSHIQLAFEGSLNPMLEMMVSKPLKQFLSDLIDKIAAL